MKKAIYAGSFDPLTNGHLWVITEAAKLFDEVLVTIAYNPDKKSYFSAETREDILNKSLIHLKNVKVIRLPQAYTAKFAKEQGCEYWIRGVRNASDLEYEKTILKVNASINPELKTIVLLPPEELVHVSSSLVKSLIGFPGWQKVVRPMIPNLVTQKINASINQTYLLKQWIDLSGELSQKWYNRLINHFCEPQRYYHNVSHVVDLLHQLKKMQTSQHLSIREITTLRYAIWFHDSIYDPSRQDNEELSAELWSEYYKDSGISDLEMHDQVKKIILATKNHTGTVDDKTALFLDLDLSILAASSERFDEYDKEIRLEYGFVPEDIYERERKKILTKFFNTTLFKSPWGKGLEEKAKENLKKRIG